MNRGTLVRLHLGLIIAAASLCVSCAGVGSGESAALATRIQRIENGLLPAIVIKGRPVVPMTLSDRMTFHKTPGISVAVIHGGALEWARGYGVRQAGESEPVTPRTLFQAASISKPVAAAAALRLVQEGTLDLDEDVNRTLTSWRVSENEFTKEKKVTLRGLLSHTAGLTVHGYEGYAAGEAVPTLAQILDGAKPANSVPTRVDILPGSRWRYAGGGYSVMQQLLVDVTGKPFPELMRETVLRKLGMADSTYQQPLNPKQRSQAASGHDERGVVIQGRWHTYPEMAAAGLWTTPSDLGRFAIELQQSAAGRSNRLLSAEMARGMLTPGLGDWGLGFGVKGKGRESRFSHSGSNEGFRATLIAYRETGQGAVVMTNSDNGAALVAEILLGIAKEYGWPDYAPKEKDLADVSAEVYDLYTGVYELSPEVAVTVSRQAQTLVAEAQGRKYELLPESETSFFTLTGLEVRFVKDATGKVTHLVLGGGAEARKIR
ncbi:MAG: serine hydrolase [Thermoanaerobaculia bacterium]